MAEKIFDEMFDDTTLDKVQKGDMKTLSSLVKDLDQLTIDINEKEEELKSLKLQKHKMSTEQIPAMMDEMGVQRLDVENLSVSLKPLINASIPPTRRDEAYQWLRENDLDDIIKNDVIMSFGKGEDNMAGDIMYELEQRGMHPEKKTHIHSMTLKAFIRERVEKGLPIDLDLFGAFVARTADIKRS
jgi:hypothetical protein|tara:strand:- start:2169 stop:2726 length:558 start_codon:yes stop_codon:yes gene_type:complete